MLKNILITILLLAISSWGFSQSYPSSNAKKSDNYKITEVDFSDLNNTSGKSDYSNYTSQVANLVTGNTYILSVTVADDNNQYLTAWIDWNNDGDFDDSGEEYILAEDVSGAAIYTQTISIPAAVVLNTETRIRITILDDVIPENDFEYKPKSGGKIKGEVEDYNIEVTNPPLPPANREDLMYYVSDADDKLYILDVTDGSCSEIGSNGVSNIEAIANWPAHLGNQLYAANGGDLGILNTSTGAYSKIGEIDGGGTANGSVGSQSLNDVDGLAFDARTGILWASNRRSSYDIMFQINISTGKFVDDAFGIGIDYVVIDGVGVNEDIDDISISPVTGEMYVVNNNSGSSDQILKINKSTGAVQVTTNFADLDDVEGCDFAFNGTFYVTEGSSNSTFNSANTTTGSSIQINDDLCGGGDVECVASLVAETNSMEGNLWKDTDEDGVKDAGENTGIANVDIKIYFDANGDGVINGSDEYLNTVTTDLNGDWYFEFATTGHLIAIIDEATLPVGYAITTTDIQTASFTTSGNTDLNNNFGAIDGFDDCDEDGIPDFVEGTGDSDGDLVPDKCDKDSDNDGILDIDESTLDTDGDGIKDYLDIDSDNDGISDAKEANGGINPLNYNNSGRITGSVDGYGLPTAVYTEGVSDLANYDTDGDGVKDYRDLDSDNDGILDIVEAGGDDSNGNGTVDSFTDSNNDGYNDSFVGAPLAVYNNDIATEAVVKPLPNYRDIDSDDDSIDDTREGYSPEDYTLISIIKDSDGDGILDLYDISSGGASIVPHDYDNDGVPDYQDQDSDNDGALDITEGNDADGNGVADSSPSGLDINKNGLDDTFDNSCTGASAIKITASSKNEEQKDGGAYTGSSDIELVYDGELQKIGIRFTGVNIAQGSSIGVANIQFTADDNLQSGAVSFTISGDDSNDANDVGGDDDITDRTKTTASVTWSPAAWTVDGEVGEAQKTANISSIIQEIVNRSGWVSGNAILIIIEGTSTTNFRHADWNNGKPVLNISTTDGLQYNCGSAIAINDVNNNDKKDFRDAGTVLPVSLISFTVDKVVDYVDINWTTASEINNDYFIVEKSNDNKNYQEIDLVKGAGNSNITLDYKSIDFDMLQGVSYYRLKQVDFDGTTAYSNVVSVRNISGEGIKIYPNPSSGQFTIDVKEPVEVSIYTVTGQIVYNNTFDANTNNRVDLSGQKKGVYIITYSNNTEVKTSKLIIK